MCLKNDNMIKASKLHYLRQLETVILQLSFCKTIIVVWAIPYVQLLFYCVTVSNACFPHWFLLLPLIVVLFIIIINIFFL